METLDVFGQSLKLRRYPREGSGNLRAWDAADEFLLRQLTEEGLPAAGSKVLVVNDSFGALSVALSSISPASWSDSHLARLALAENQRLNGLAPDKVRFIGADTDPQENFDLVLLKFPKSLAWWQDCLLRLRPFLHENSRIISGGMIKHTTKRIFTLLASCLGPTKTSLGRKKARLAFTEFDPALDCPGVQSIQRVQVPELGLTLDNQANVFSRDRLDPGTRLLLQHLPLLEGPAHVTDVGCGNGVLSLAMAQRCPEAVIVGTDESFQAVASARSNARTAGLEIEFKVMDGCRDLPEGNQDLVLCNPPFHQDRVVGDGVARMMFQGALGILKSGGELRVVGNRHLGYHTRLTEMFGRCTVISEDGKFVVLSAVK